MGATGIQQIYHHALVREKFTELNERISQVPCRRHIAQNNQYWGINRFSPTCASREITSSAAKCKQSTLAINMPIACANESTICCQ